MFPDSKDKLVVSLVEDCLILDPCNRISAAEALQHSFFQDKRHSSPASDIPPHQAKLNGNTKISQYLKVIKDAEQKKPFCSENAKKQKSDGVDVALPQSRAVSPRIRTRAASPAVGRAISLYSETTGTPRRTSARALSSSNVVARRAMSPHQLTRRTSKDSSNAPRSRVLTSPSAMLKLAGKQTPRAASKEPLTRISTPASTPGAPGIKRPPSPRRTRSPAIREISNSTNEVPSSGVSFSSTASPRLIRRVMTGGNSSTGPKVRVESPLRQRGTINNGPTAGEQVMTRYASPRNRLYRPTASSSNIDVSKKVAESSPIAAEDAVGTPRRTSVRALSSSNVVAREAISFTGSKKVSEKLKRSEHMGTSQQSKTLRREINESSTSATRDILDNSRQKREALVDLSTNESLTHPRARQDREVIITRHRSVSPRHSHFGQRDNAAKDKKSSSLSSSTALLASRASTIKSIGRQLLDDVDSRKKKSSKEMELLRNAVDKYLGKHQIEISLKEDISMVTKEMQSIAQQPKPPPPPPPVSMPSKSVRRAERSKLTARRASSVDAITRRRLGTLICTFLYFDILCGSFSAPFSLIQIYA